MQIFRKCATKAGTLLLVLAFLFPPGARSDEPFSEFSSVIASFDDQFTDPYEQLQHLEKFYRQVSQNRLDYGLRAASMYLDKAYQISDSLHIAKGYHLRAMAFSKAGDFPNALKDNLSSLEITERKGDTIAMCNSYNNLGILFEKLQNGDQALYYFEKSLFLSRIMDDVYGAAHTLENMGILYGNMGENDKAIDALMEARKVWISTNDTVAIAHNLGNMGNFYMSTGDFVLATDFFNQAIDRFEKNNDKQNLAYTYLNQGLANAELNDYANAMGYFTRGLSMARAAHQAHLSSLFYRSKAETFANMGMFEDAYQNSIKYHSLKDSLMNEDALQQITFYHTLYETETKEREIMLLKKEQEVRDLQLAQKNISLEKSRFRATILMFSLITTIMAGVILVSRNRQKRIRIINAEKILYQREQIRAIIKTQEEERIRFARDLHDGLGQMLTALKINLSQVNATDNSIEEPPPAANSLIKEMHQEIRNISFNIMPQLLLQKGLIPALTELARKINSLEKLSVSVAEHEVSHRFEPSVEIAIYRILQELLNNIIKYSKAENVSIQLVQHENMLNIHVEDDGQGFDISRLKKSKGSGWKNICSRLKYIDGSIEFDSEENRRYTTVILDIPIKQKT